MAESDGFYVKWGGDHDGAMKKWLWPLFFELWAFLFPNFALQNRLEKPVFTATFEMLLWANGDRDVIETYLVLIKHFKKSALALETMLCTRRNRRFFKPEISVIFGILAKGGLHEKLLESEILEMRRWSRCYNGKVAVTIISWVMSISISEICPPKWAWKSRFDRNIWNAAAGKRRPWRHWKLIGVKVPIKHFKRRFLAP